MLALKAITKYKLLALTLLIAIVGGSFNAYAHVEPLSEDPFFASEEIFLAFKSNPYRAASYLDQLQSLGPAYIPLIKDLIYLRHDFGSVHAMKTLSNIKDNQSIALLRECFTDTTLSTAIRLAAADGLSDIRDTESISTMKTAIEASDDMYFVKYTERAIVRMENPELDRPLIVCKNDRLIFRFLFRDVERVEFVRNSGPTPGTYKLPSDELLEFFEILRASYKEATTKNMWAMNHAVTIVLKDGREARLLLDEGFVFDSDESRFTHSSSFTFKNPAIADFITESMSR